MFVLKKQKYTSYFQVTKHSHAYSILPINLLKSSTLELFKIQLVSPPCKSHRMVTNSTKHFTSNLNIFRAFFFFKVSL